MTDRLSSSSQTDAAPQSVPVGAPFAERHFLACAAVLLLAMGVAMFAGVFLDSDTMDEAFHLRFGYTFLRTGQLPAVLEHPPLAQALSALPLLLLDLRLWPPDPSSGSTESQWRTDADFLYHNRVPAGTILAAGRSVKVVLTLLFGGFIAWWTRRHFGAVPALAALLLFAFDPTFIAHGHLATTDVLAAFGFLAGCLSWDAFLARGSMRSALWCGLVTGLALAVKYSALLLPLLYAYLYLMHGFQQAAALEAPRWRCSLGHFVKSMATVLGGAFVALYVSYGFETRPLLPAELSGTPLSAMLAQNPSTVSAGAILQQYPGLKHAVDQAALRVPIPAPSFLRGILYFSSHSARGHRSYLLGETGSRGWWYYFPVVSAVKTPTGGLALLLLAVAAALAITLRAGPRAGLFQLLRARQEWYTLTIPPLVYFAISMRNHVDIGIRHILPVYPFVFIWIGAMLFTFRRPGLPAFFRRAAAVCLALVAVESAAAFPRYLAFFNVPSGGRSQGSKYVVDSNLDWGQDMKRLQEYLQRSGAAGNVCLEAFTVAPPSYYGVTAHPIPRSAEEARAQGCLVVMGMSILHEWQPFDGRYDWLERREPTGRVGDSFWVYDVRAHP
jgi:4-amino-4-deoxy-L-arabinose transferase-like glycosyltransferase